MTLAVREERVSSVREQYVTEPLEVMAHCPGCKAFQTVWLKRDVLMSTRRFTQKGNQIYHNCGSEQPCHLYFSW